MNDLKEFITPSKTFNGFIFKGNYDMSDDDFIAMFGYYAKTGMNLLDDYSNMIYLQWNDNQLCSLEEIKLFDESQSRLRHSRLFDPDWLSECRAMIKALKLKHRKYLEKKLNEKRIIASKETSKLSVRNKVFELYGEKCLRCGSEKNIQIDHVIPVHCGGENKIENYQPLCKTCNVRKGTNIIDYRK